MAGHLSLCNRHRDWQTTHRRAHASPQSCWLHTWPWRMWRMFWEIRLMSRGDTFIRLCYGLVLFSYSSDFLFAFWKYTMTLHFKYTELCCAFFEHGAKLWYRCVFLKVKYFSYFFATASQPRAFSIPGQAGNFNRLFILRSSCAGFREIIAILRGGAAQVSFGRCMSMHIPISVETQHK